MNLISIIVSIFIGMLLLSLLSFLWPLIAGVLFVVMIFSLIRFVTQANSVRRRARDDINRQWDEERDNNRSTHKNNSNDDIIDVEYTEEDLD